MTHEPQRPDADHPPVATAAVLTRRSLLVAGLVGAVVTVGVGIARTNGGLVGGVRPPDAVASMNPLAASAAPRQPTPALTGARETAPTTVPTATTPPTAVPTVLPTARPLPTATVAVAMPQPALISRATWGAVEPAAAFTPQQPRQITLHHEGVLFDGSVPAAQYLRQVQAWSIHNRGWPDIPYHFIIDLAGMIYEGRPLTALGSSNTKYDLRGHVHIALLGKYDAGEQQPSSGQIQTIIALMAWIADTYTLTPDMIHGHRDFIPLNARGEHIDPRTKSRITCPGDNLYRYLADGTIPQGVAALLAQYGSRQPRK